MKVAKLILVLIFMVLARIVLSPFQLLTFTLKLIKKIVEIVLSTLQHFLKLVEVEFKKII